MHKELLVFQTNLLNDLKKHDPDLYDQYERAIQKTNRKYLNLANKRASNPTLKGKIYSVTISGKRFKV
jgi:hypothetical protein